MKYWQIIIIFNITKETNISQSVEQMAFTDDLIFQPESVTETSQANQTTNIKAKDNYRSDKKSNNSSASVIWEKKNVVILSDSMIKHINVHEMSKKLENCQVYLKSFSGSNVQCMKDHLNQSMREKLDHTILYVGAND